MEKISLLLFVIGAVLVIVGAILALISSRYIRVHGGFAYQEGLVILNKKVFRLGTVIFVLGWLLLGSAFVGAISGF